MIKTVEETPNTVITLINDTRYIVKESAQTILERIIQYKREIYSNTLSYKE